MNNYKYLKYVIGQFSADWEFTKEEYGDNFAMMLGNEGFVERIKVELIAALSDPEWSWVKIGHDTNFIGSDDTEESVWSNVKELIWDHIFLNQEPPLDLTLE